MGKALSTPGQQSTIVAQGRSNGPFLFAAILYLVGVVPSVILGWAGFRGLSDPLVRFVAPGIAEATIEQPGDYTVFYEYRSEIDGREFSTPNTVPPMEIVMFPEGGGQPVSILASNGGMSYEFGSKAGRSIGALSLDEATTYDVSAEYTNRATQPEIVLGLGYEKGRSVAQLVIGTIGFFLSGMVASVIFFVGRSRRRREARTGQDQLSAAGFDPTMG